MSYTKIKELGRGGFGCVWEVEDETHQHLALKQFLPGNELQIAIDKGVFSLDSVKARFRREVKYQSQINSKNVVKILDHDLDADEPWFVMPLANGTLKEKIDLIRQSVGDPTDALFDVLAGLEDIHKHGIVHRDLKPVNVLQFLDEDGNEFYAISDFGLISALASDTTTLTQTGHGGGTPIYAAPELIRRFKHATSAADIYSFGAILHDIFDGGNRTPYLEQTVGGPCRKIVEKCTKTNPGRRYSDIPSLRADLYQALNNQTIIFTSNDEKEISDLLKRDTPLTDNEWDRVYAYAEDSNRTAVNLRNIFTAFSAARIVELADSSSELLNAIGSEFSSFVRDQSHDFDYCDVLADRIEVLFNRAGVALQAHCLITLAELGVSHNRWFVERKFAKLASPNLPANVAERMLMDAEAEKIDLQALVRQIIDGINIKSHDLHSLLDLKVTSDASSD
ncbi:serine/threonine protein kinase [Variovorax sp. PAMC28562]|uniref:serine/threonine-protein kinase n=1 Tax=Variovorax sp. PAMC28562 TaxID=2762323 RepID=UPI00164E744E|nr:serine/threonine-protein kinase [Variovorax sp. PAMC28562]QNK72196.1 serine/threonine protein kinase [Variovorax sp. PAMC28562]